MPVTENDLAALKAEVAELLVAERKRKDAESVAVDEESRRIKYNRLKRQRRGGLDTRGGQQEPSPEAPPKAAVDKTPTPNPVTVSKDNKST